MRSLGWLSRWLVISGCFALLCACGRVVGPNRGPVAPELQSVVRELHGVQIPILLPRSLPTPPPGSRYVATVQTTSASYLVTIAATNATGTTSESGTVGSIHGGKSGQKVGSDVASMARMSGHAEAVSLPGGIKADFFEGEGVSWAEGGWNYVVVDRIDNPSTVQPLVPFVTKMRHALPSWGNPIAAGTSGLAVQTVAPSNADIRLTWSEGNVTYAVWGHTESAIQLAKSLVRVER